MAKIQRNGILMAITVGMLAGAGLVMHESGNLTFIGKAHATAPNGPQHTDGGPFNGPTHIGNKPHDPRGPHKPHHPKPHHPKPHEGGCGKHGNCSTWTPEGGGGGPAPYTPYPFTAGEYCISVEVMQSCKDYRFTRRADGTVMQGCHDR